jgi:quinol monooxygenase YgiN
VAVPTSELQSIVRFSFRGGDVEEFKRLSERCMEIVRTQDTGTLQYDTFFNDDETEAIVLERFRDEQALIEHSENIGEEMMAAIVATGSCSGELLGDLSDELRARMAGGPVGLFAPYRRL